MITTKKRNQTKNWKKKKHTFEIILGNFSGFCPNCFQLVGKEKHKSPSQIDRLARMVELENSETSRRNTCRWITQTALGFSFCQLTGLSAGVVV
jgi:hypothetical protein